MALFDKLNRMARTIGDMTNEALESSRSASKLSADRKAADEQFKIIGEYYYNLYLNGYEVADDLTEHFETAKVHMDAIAAAEEEERIRREAEEEERIRREEEERARREAEREAEEQSGVICPDCGAQNRSGTKFCCECGSKLAAEPPKPRSCPECGTPVDPGKRFCGECGFRLDE